MAAKRSLGDEADFLQGSVTSTFLGTTEQTGQSLIAPYIPRDLWRNNAGDGEVPKSESTLCSSCPTYSCKSKCKGATADDDDDGGDGEC